MDDRTRRAPLCALLLAALFAAACGDSPTGPDADINPALLEPGDAMGISTGAAPDLPQGSAGIAGPGGMAMDATAEEFVQQLTLEDGTVLRTSGIYIRAAPDRSVSNPSFHRMSAGTALTGSLASVGPGSYAITADWPDVNFIDVVPVTYGTVAESQGSTTVRASSGTFTIRSVNYFADVYPCDTPSAAAALVIERCDYQLGLLVGSFSLRATISSGELVQPATEFTLPIRRKTIVARRN